MRKLTSTTSNYSSHYPSLCNYQRAYTIFIKITYQWNWTLQKHPSHV